jgi:hypothetical protein
MSQRRDVLAAMLAGATSREALTTETGLSAAALSAVMSPLKSAKVVGGDAVDGWRVLNQAEVRRIVDGRRPAEVDPPEGTPPAHRHSGAYRILNVLLRDNFPPMPRAQLEEDSDVRSRAASAALQVLVGRGLVRGEHGGFAVSDRAAAEAYVRDHAADDAGPDPVEKFAEHVAALAPAAPRRGPPPPPRAQHRGVLGSLITAADVAVLRERLAADRRLLEERERALDLVEGMLRELAAGARPTAGEMA